MNNNTRILAILLSMLLILSSFVAVFAEGEEALQTVGDGIQAAEETVDENTDPVTDTDELQADTAEDAVTDQDAVSEEPVETSEDAAEPVADEAPEAVLESAEAAATVNVTVNYVDENGNKLADSVTGDYEVGATIPSPTIACYTPDKDEIVVAASDVPVVEKVTYEPAAPKKVSGLKLHPSYKSIILTWNKVDGAAKYIVQRATSKDGKYSTLKTLDATTAKTMTYKDLKATGTEKKFNTALTYYYRVYAVSDHDLKSVAASVSGTCVRPMYEEVTFKAAATLNSHGGKKRTTTFKAGQTIIAQGFGGGKYKFWYNGSYYYANYIRMKNCKAKYQSNANGILGKATSYKGIWAKQNYAQNGENNYKGIKYYDKVSAENFVNKSGKKSKTKYLIWVSTYTQHLYIFKGSKGKWKLYKDWECSTGAAKSPTPTGFDKSIYKKMKSYSNIRYWNPFQTLNSIHGQRKSYRFGKPQSNGCVRNYDKNAKWVYDNCKVGTGVIIY